MNECHSFTSLPCSHLSLIVLEAQIDKHTHTYFQVTCFSWQQQKKNTNSLIIIWLNANYDRNVSAHGHALAQLCHMSELTTHEFTNTYSETHVHAPVCTWTWLTQRMGLATVKQSNSTQIRRYTPKHLKNVNILPIWSRHRWVTKPHPIMHCMKFLYLKMGRVSSNHIQFKVRKVDLLQCLCYAWWILALAPFLLILRVMLIFCNFKVEMHSFLVFCWFFF